MTSPFERAAQAADLAAKLPADNWRQRRIDTINAHVPSITTVSDVITKLGGMLLGGRISTDIIYKTKDIDLDTTNPSDQIAQATIGILPTGVSRKWSGRDIFTPDTALSVGIHLEDRYTYKRPGVPQPQGHVKLCLYARSWGRLTSEDEEAMRSIPGIGFEYGDNGFERRGTRVTVWREPGQIIEQPEVETILAPLAAHVFSYFDIMGLKNPGDDQPVGNFSNRNTTYIEQGYDLGVYPEQISWVNRMISSI